MTGTPRGLATLLASLLVAAPAWGQPRSQGQAAGELVRQAIAKSQAGDHLGAIDLYLQAYAMAPQHALLSNVGNEYQQAGRPVEALKYFCMYLEKDPSGTSAAYATSKAKALHVELGHGAVDDEDLCKPVAPADGRDGREVEAKLDVGATRSPSSPSRTLQYVGIGAGVAGLAVLGAGVFFGLKAKKISDDITHHPQSEPWQEDIGQLEADGQRYEDRQIQLMVAGGALVAAGAVLVILGRPSRPRSPESLSVRPTASPDSIGISLGGGF
ncbi:MAG: hypothetical protein ACTHU0_05410 [Kofleriaceae bacterium]